AIAEPVEVLTYLEPNRSIEISAVERGVVGEILVAEGNAVKAGDTLIKLDAAVEEARLAVAKNQAASKGRQQAAQAAFDQQNNRYKKLVELSETGAANQAELDREKAELDIAQANLTIAKEDTKTFDLSVKQIEAEIARKTLKTPIDGTVVEITKDIAESVSEVMARDGNYLVRIVQTDVLKCVGHVPSAAAGGLKVGDELWIRLDSEDAPDAKGRIEFVSPIINPATSTVRVRLVIDNSDSRFRSGDAAAILVE
ncbi:MAG: efflux RND transporter periplasmic adaptor subunit, partial [Verrucomicrobiota bacterium]